MRPVPGTQCSDVNCHHRRLENRQGEKKLGKNRKLLKVLKLKNMKKLMFFFLKISPYINHCDETIGALIIERTYEVPIHPIEW